MSLLRQMGSGLLYALVSVVLVVGGLSLALAEGSRPASPPTPMPSVTVPVPTVSTSTSTSTNTATATGVSSPVIYTATSQAIQNTSTAAIASPTTYVQPAATSTRRAYPTLFACGPYAGWVKAYTVQTGDTLFHIATLYRTTVTALQIANCKTTTLIYPGERLWIPNLPTVTPGITLIPTFPTSTPVPTEPLTLTPVPIYFTETAIPTATPTSQNP